MAKTISQLTELATTPADSDYFVLDAGGVTKKVSSLNVKGDCLRVVSSTVTVPDTVNVAFNTATGTKLGTATTQKLGFYNATPVTQRPLTDDLLDSLQATGLVASGAGNTPLNLTSGALTCGALTSGAVTCGNIASSGTVGCGTITLTDASNIAAGTTTGTKVGTATTQKLGFWNVTPVVQPSGANQAALTDNTTGTAGTSLVAAGTTYTAANINNNFASLNRLVAELRGALVSSGLIKGSA
jgi:hypothetical protein